MDKTSTRRKKGTLKLATFLLSLCGAAITVVPAYGRFDPVTLQPVACAGGQAVVVDTDDNYLEIGQTGKVVDCTDSGRADSTAGYLVTLPPGENLMLNYQGQPEWYAGKACILYFKERKKQSLNNVTVSFQFKPQLGRPDLVTVKIPLKSFQLKPFRDFLQASASLEQIWGNRPGIPDLKKVSVVLQDRGLPAGSSIQLGSIIPVINNGGPSFSGVDQLIMKTADCSVLP